MVPASAQALTLQASSPETGWITLTVPDAGPATHVALAEQVGSAVQAIADQSPAAGQVVVRHAATWRCDRFDRRFVATAAYPDGTTQSASATIRTASCAKRFTLAVRKLRGRLRVRLGDRWKVGDAAPQVCLRAPGMAPACRPVSIAAGRRFVQRDYRTRAPGLWRLGLGAASRTVYVRPAGKLRLLATGDSMIQIVDSDLKNRLGKRRVSVRSDARISTGLSKPFLLDWPKLAAKQARDKPDATVVFIGANDGFPFGDVNCCGDAWVEAYAKRAEAMMRSYSREGRGLVYWLTLPAPQPAQWRPIYPAVNRAIKRAAKRFKGDVRVIDTAKTFTPNGQFRKSMLWHGKRQTVRQDDGVHLSPAGAAIAETLIERALEKEGAL